MGIRRGIAIAALFAAASCQLPPQRGDSYSLQGDPWSQPQEAKAGKTGKDGEAPAGDSKDAASAPRPAGAPTMLEQLEESRARVAALEKENARLLADGASLTTLVEQLRQQNQNLAQLADANVTTRSALDQEIEKLRQEGKELDVRCRTLADDLLAERIQRVRVERELILAKVKEAESRDDGP